MSTSELGLRCRASSIVTVLSACYPVGTSTPTAPSSPSSSSGRSDAVADLEDGRQHFMSGFRFLAGNIAHSFRL